MLRLGLLLCVLLAACSAGSGEGLDASGRPIGEAPDPSDLPTLDNIQARIFTPVCIQCHVGAAAPQGLRLDASNAFNDLVGVPSREVSGLDRVEPFDPDRSYLFQKISGTASVGGRMPLGGPSLPDQDIELVRQWISDGASPTAVSSVDVAKVSDVHMSSDNGSMAVSITFTQPIDPTSVLPSSFSLIRSEDLKFDEYDASIDGISIGTVRNRFAVSVRFPEAALPGGHYQLYFGDDTTTQILDVAGRAVAPYAVIIDKEMQ